MVDVSSAILNKLKSPIFLKTRDLLFARASTNRHFESWGGRGDEVGERNNGNNTMAGVRFISLTLICLVFNC